jgi:hypothetical protein
MFERIARIDNRRRSGGSAFLLNDVGQLVGNQSATRQLPRCEASFSEDDMIPHAVRERVDRLRRVGRRRISVDPHTGEVMAEARLHERPGRLIELPPR